MSGLRPTKPSTTVDAAGLADALGARVHVDITIPRTDIRAKMRLVSRQENGEARAAARKVLAGRGMPTGADQLNGPGVFDEWNNEIAVQTLARAVRDPSDVNLALAPVEDWQETLDDDQIAALYLEYKDLAARLDPIASSEKLTPAELVAIDDAGKKKDMDLLMSFGSLKLSLFIATSAAPPAS